MSSSTDTPTVNMRMYEAMRREGTISDYFLEPEKPFIPKGYPGVIRNGAIILPGDEKTMAASIIKHLEYVGKYSRTYQFLVFKPEWKNVDTKKVEELVMEKLIKMEELESKTALEVVKPGFMVYLCAMSAYELALIAEIIESSLAQMVKNVADIPGLHILMKHAILTGVIV